jgi:hypothetical protein
MVVQTKEHILALLRDQHARISALGVKRLGLFGSFERGQQRTDSGERAAMAAPWPQVDHARRRGS